ncbi:MAG: hypothetical protein HQ522_01535 [Bacteroidetes bacterium]|nr:hypothetical protein [Bacteroidota bacterium]
MLRKTCLSFFILFLSQSLFAQDIDQYIKPQQTVPYQKLYLHTDREFYFTGDTLWFAAYLVEGQTHIPKSELCNLYVDLIDTDGKLIKHEMFLVQNGFGSGYVSISDSAKLEGNFLLRGYTDYLQNFGGDAFFSKTIQISAIKNSFELLSADTIGNVSNEIDVSFLPEGGFLLADRINLVAFKAINRLGKEVNIKGKLIEERGQFVASFYSNYKGMGSFYFIPKKGINYKVEVEGYPKLEFEFPETGIEGAKLMVPKIVDNQVSLNIITSEEKPKTPFYIVVMHRGKKLFHLEIVNYETLKTIRVKTRLLKEGINRFILLNQNFEPLSERLVFINKNEDILLKLKLNQTEFSTREKVSLQIQNLKRLNKEENAQLSVVIINEDAISASGVSQNIKSYLLIDSELKGQILTPADYFVNDDKITSETKLNFLMLTNGWKNYLWNNLKKEDYDIKFEPQIGVTISGNVKYKKRFLNNTDVSLIISSNNETYLDSTKTNLIGNFSFKNQLVYDTAVFFIQSNGFKGGWNTEIEFDSADSKIPLVSHESLNHLTSFSSIPFSLHRIQYYNQMALKEFYPEANTIMIEQVDVKTKKQESDDHFRMYASPNYSLQLDESDHIYANIFQYLGARVPGVKVWGNRIKIRQAPAFTRTSNMGFQKDHNDEPLYLLDGFMVDGKTLSMLSVKEIDKIEILKGAVAGIFGGLGENGVVSILTKKDYFPYYGPDEIPGTVYHKIKGFSKCREFYSPKYTLENINSEKPDYRTTLYWNPKVTLENGKAEVSFFTCDNISRYKIFVEGITESGRICLGSGEFEVDSFNEQLNLKSNEIK